VRTFTPIVAGVAEMKYSTFVRYNILGGLLWGVGVTTLGYFLGEIDFIKNNLEVAAVIVVAISLTPIAIEFWRHRRDVAEAAEAAAAALVDD
jgi:membrane-associated protein